jgi:methylglutaconyl-CoA hydratase
MDVLAEQHDHVQRITLNRPTKHNAFDSDLLLNLQAMIQNAEHDPNIRVIVLGAEGHDFSAGADVAWMQRMANFTEAENLADAKILAEVLATLHKCSKPTIAMVQGAAFGGGAGLVAACDIAIASENARFCFSEVKLGLIPAVISPYVIQAIGQRTATWLFMSAEMISAQKALELSLVQHCVPHDDLLSHTLRCAHTIANHAPMAVRAAKALVRDVVRKTIDSTLLDFTANLIAKKRVSEEGQRGLNAFLNKQTPNWE